jgi:geranylgeranyl pyrophosphate synthase
MSKDNMAGHFEIFESIRDDLTRVERKLGEKPQLEYEVLTVAIEHLLSSGGKRIRPALVILTSHLYSAEIEPEAIALAAAVEMLHTASLVHDDLIDGSLLRRGIPTLNAEWTPGATILTGDYLFARAADLAAQAGSLRVMRLFADTLMVICTGELKQQFSDLQTRTRRDDYFARIYAKTASLLTLATEAAGILRNAPEDQVTALREYGYHLGMAFQVVDDVLDFVGNQTHMGKPVASDLRQGLVTLPTLCYLEQHPDDPLIVRILKSGRGNDEDIRQAVRAIRESGAIDSALAEARDLAHRSLQALERLPAGPPRRAMEDLTDFVVQRRT